MNRQEQRGQFYLGSTTEQPQRIVHYDATDLTTHAVIIGMTGSGKTGLGICLLEEAALNNIPIIAIDPKGDLGNLALNFPELRPEDFAPWADPAQLARENISLDMWSERTATSWHQGIVDSVQSQARMRTLKNANPVTVYTPGSQAGVALSLLADLAPPQTNSHNDTDDYADALDSCASALLALIAENADPFAAQHVLLTAVLNHYWVQHQSPTLTDIIKTILHPPFTTLGVMPLDDVINSNARKQLANRFNGLLATPSFAAWTQGAPLNCQSLFFDAQSRPQTAVLNIAHLSENERQYFITLLLTNLIAWMRTQSGTATLRAILYMDELFGYLPPNANPPTKKSLLTLLKQARAYGLGLVLSTQNPVDLDYKALSNTGSWFIGHLQTAQDKARLRDGLLAAAPKLTAATLDDKLNQLGKRTFLLHNIHEDAPCLFRTRWSMSYLAGPMDKNRLAQLKTNTPKSIPSPRHNTVNLDTDTPLLADGIATYYAPLPLAMTNSTSIAYRPWLLARTTLYYQDRISHTHYEQHLTLITDATSSNPTWSDAERSLLTPAQLSHTPPHPATHVAATGNLADKRVWQTLQKSLMTYLRQQCVLTLYHAKLLESYSLPEEDEQTFRNRLIPQAHTARDQVMEKVRARYASKRNTLEKQLLNAENQLDRQESQRTQSWLDAGISIGSALFTAFTGRKMFSQNKMRSASSAVRRAARVQQEQQDVAAATAKRDLIQSQLDELDSTLAGELAQLRRNYDPQTFPLDIHRIHATQQDIHIEELAVLYRPDTV